MDFVTFLGHKYLNFEDVLKGGQNVNFEDKSLSLIFSDSMYCSKAEIVRKKGKSLLNDPLYNKVNFIKAQRSCDQKNLTFQGLAYPESERDRLAIRGTSWAKKEKNLTLLQKLSKN